MKARLGALLLLASLGPGCGDSSSLGGLEGIYDLTAIAAHVGSGELVDCNLTVGGRGGSARCERSSTTSSVSHETLAVDFDFGNDTIDAEIVYVAENEPYSGECGAYVCTTTITGEATRNERHDADRRDMLQAAAGEWSGHVVIETECLLEPDSESSEWCEGEALALYAYVFEASVFGTYAEITWTGDHDSGAFEVIGAGDFLEVDGTLVPKR